MYQPSKKNCSAVGYKKLLNYVSYAVKSSFVTHIDPSQNNISNTK